QRADRERLARLSLGDVDGEVELRQLVVALVVLGPDEAVDGDVGRDIRLGERRGDGAGEGGLALAGADGGGRVRDAEVGEVELDGAADVDLAVEGEAPVGDGDAVRVVRPDDDAGRGAVVRAERHGEVARDAATGEVEGAVHLAVNLDEHRAETRG